MVAISCLGAACSGEQHASRVRVLVCASPGATISACAYAPKAYVTSALYKLDRNPPRKIAGPPPGGWDSKSSSPLGFWVADRVFVAPNGRTVLAQWSGACEGQSTYLISTRTGKIHAVFKSESYARGWRRDGRARVFLAEPGAFKGEYAYKAGLYLVDPKTMRRTLVRPVNSRKGC
jgi:hypothetical protein